jgi:hypothetical protein
VTLEAAGLSEHEVAAWRSATPTTLGSFPAAARATCEFLTRGEELLRRLPARGERSETEQSAAHELQVFLDGARADFMRAYAADVYDALTDDLRLSLRVEDLVYAAADLYPGLTPTRSAMELERARRLADKEGIEIAQGLFLSFVLSSERAGAHLVWSMLRPTEAALARLDELLEEDWVREDTAERLRGLYNFRRSRFRARFDAEDDGSIEVRSANYQRLRRELLEAERRAIVGLRSSGRISDQVMHRLERDLDLEDARLDY